MSIEKILISVLPSDAIWHRLRLKFQDHDVENDDLGSNIWDLRLQPMLVDDVVYVWGRDGWLGGYHHAILSLERNEDETLVLYATRGDHAECMPLTMLTKLVDVFIQDCMDAREHDSEDSE